VPVLDSTRPTIWRIELALYNLPMCSRCDGFSQRQNFGSLREYVQEIPEIHEPAEASTGNRGVAVAYAGRLLGIPVRIFLPARCEPGEMEMDTRTGSRMEDRLTCSWS
jgi:pyridoxal-phosphate dependent enzyme